MPTLIIHDRFEYRGGGERLVLEMAKILGADLATEFWTEQTYAKDEVPGQLFILAEGQPKTLGLRYLRAQWNFWWKTRRLLKNYDTIIFSGVNCLTAALRPLGGVRKIAYCHTPPRYVYDLLPWRRQQEPMWLKRVLFYDLGKWPIRLLYRLGLGRMNKVLANSENVQQRLIRFCHTKSTVVYPPIQTSVYRWLGQGDYYLSWARLDALKRVEKIVAAFARMPDKKLVVASGGAQEKIVRELAKGHDNITILGWIDEAKKAALVGNCLAGIYVPLDEDFGMTPVEGMVAGKPTIGVDEGGLKETIIPDVTGLLIPPECYVEDIIIAVRKLTAERALEMRAACEAQAQKFSREIFADRLREAIKLNK